MSLGMLTRVLVLCGILAGFCTAQRPVPNGNRPDKPARMLWWRITSESDQQTKIRLLESFAVEYPKDEDIGWVYEQLYAILVDSKQFDRALEVGDKLLALDPDDVEIAYKSLKVAEERKDPDLVRKWSQTAGGIARRIIAAPPAAEAASQQRLELAKQVCAYTEYLTYSTILQTATRAKKLEMVEEFLHRSPRSPYAPAVRSLYLAILRDTDPQKALAAALTMIGEERFVEDAMIIVAENYLQKEREPEQASQHAEKLLTLLERAGKPEGTTDAEWAKTRGLLSARAHWLIGSIAMQRGKFAQADRSIRASLPLLRGDAKLTSTALFNLGWANYRLGNIPDAIRFNQECAHLKGPFQEQAIKNLAVILSENPSHQ